MFWVGKESRLTWFYTDLNSARGQAENSIKPHRQSSPERTPVAARVLPADPCPTRRHVGSHEFAASLERVLKISAQASA
jgi:hypothetical protein